MKNKNLNFGVNLVRELKVSTLSYEKVATKKTVITDKARKGEKKICLFKKNKPNPSYFSTETKDRDQKHSITQDSKQTSYFAVGIFFDPRNRK